MQYLGDNVFTVCIQFSSQNFVHSKQTDWSNAVLILLHVFRILFHYCMLLFDVIHSISNV